jgi:uncharacterized damage-inducible protein DinB
MKEFFLDLFDYDLWANRLWIEALGARDASLVSAEGVAQVALPGPFPIDRHKEGSGSREVRAAWLLAHILSAQRIWLERCGTAVQRPGGDAAEWLSALNDGWRTALDQHALDEVLHYRNSWGEPFSSQFGQIVRQAMNHGTYHRGQMREIAEAGGFEWPETDYIGMVYARQ